MRNKKRNLPVHVAIIMDGNGRWAVKRGLPRVVGHKIGMESVREVIKSAREIGIKVLTLYAFSTENWNRPKAEVNALMKHLNYYLNKELNSLKKNNIRFIVSGRVDDLPETVQRELKLAIDATLNNDGMILNITLSYGGRQEILDAVNRIVEERIMNEIKNRTELTEEGFRNYLYMPKLPDPDLFIRTGGEMRISNFLLWQISYTELYFTKKLWPDFRKKDFCRAIEAFQSRNRRFGG